jgi:DNA-directed RNA polymerase III subunit RPC3
MPLRRARQGLATLLQDHLVLFNTAEEDGRTYYSVDWRNAYNLARQQSVIELVDQRHGEGAARVVQHILQLGYAKVGDLVEAYDLEPRAKGDSRVDTAAHHHPETGIMNGSTKPKVGAGELVSSAEDLHLILHTLLKSGILIKVSARAFMPVSDLQDHIEESVIADCFPDRKVTGPKKQLLFKGEVNAVKRKWKNEEHFSEFHDIVATSRGTIKRPGEHFEPSRKRVRTNGDLSNGVHHDSESLALKVSVPYHCFMSSITSLILY